MYVSPIRRQARTWARPSHPDSPAVPLRATPRGEHARMLQIAAARRLRAAERAGLSRSEDADYWKAVAPAALRRAAVLRREPGFARLPR